MQRLVTLAPDQYEGQMLCPRCGNDGTGHRYQTCEGPFYTHAQTCERYRYHEDHLCTNCEDDFALDEMS